MIGRSHIIVLNSNISSSNTSTSLWRTRDDSFDGASF